jgi:hypothetical protein
MKPLLLLWLAVLLGSPAGAQLLHQRVYGSAGEESYGYLTPLRSGGYLLAGKQQKPPLSTFDEKLYLVRTNGQGDTLWTRAHKLPGFNVINVRGVCENAAGQVLIAANGGDINTSTSDEAMLVLLSSQGDTLWTRRTKGPTDDYYFGLLLGNDNTFVLSGSLNTFPQWLKINAAGQVVAQTNINYDAAEVGVVTYLFKDNSALGGYWVLNAKGITGSSERKLVHLTETGVVDQTKPLYGGGRSFITSIVPIAGQGGYLACENGRLTRFNSALDTVWTKTLSYTNGFVRGGAGPRLIQPLADGNFVMAGGFFYAGGTRVYLGKVTANGQVLRDTVLFRTGGDELIQGLAVAPGTSNYVFSGYAADGPLGSYDLFLGIHANWRVLETKTPRQLVAGALDAWPNPHTGQAELHVRAKQPLPGLLMLHDLVGRPIRSWAATRALTAAGGQRLSLAGVPAGSYLLTATAADGRRYVTRIVRE